MENFFSSHQTFLYFFSLHIREEPWITGIGQRKKTPNSYMKYTLLRQWSLHTPLPQNSIKPDCHFLCRELQKWSRMTKRQHNLDSKFVTFRLILFPGTQKNFCCANFFLFLIWNNFYVRAVTWWTYIIDEVHYIKYAVTYYAIKIKKHSLCIINIF